MVLLRLVWIQIRPYKPMVSEFTVALVERFSEESNGQCQIRLNLELGKTPAAKHLENKSTSFAVPEIFIQILRGVTRDDCKDGEVGLRFLLRLNQWLYVSTVIAATLATRLLVRSWTLSVGVAAVLLSRGTLLSAAEFLDLRIFLQSLSMAIFLVSVHVIRSASKIMIAGLFALILLACLSDPIFLLVPFAPLVFVCFLILKNRWQSGHSGSQWSEEETKRNLILRRISRGTWAGNLTGDERVRGGLAFFLWLLRHPAMLSDHLENQNRPTQSEDLLLSRGGLLRPLSMPFSQWLRVSRQWKQYTAYFGLGCLLCFVMLALFFWTGSFSNGGFGPLNLQMHSFMAAHKDSWWGTLIDFHWLFSVICIMIFIAMPGRGLLLAIKNASLMAIIMMFLLGGMEMILNRISSKHEIVLNFDLTLYIMQPAVLVLGVCAIYGFFVKVSEPH